MYIFLSVFHVPCFTLDMDAPPSRYKSRLVYIWNNVRGYRSIRRSTRGPKEEKMQHISRALHHTINTPHKPPPVMPPPPPPRRCRDITCPKPREKNKGNHICRIWDKDPVAPLYNFITWGNWVFYLEAI